MTEIAHPDRLQKLERLRAEGHDPFPARGVVATPAADLEAKAGTAEAHGPLIGETVTVAGRLRDLRDFGKRLLSRLRKD